MRRFKMLTIAAIVYISLSEIQTIRPDVTSTFILDSVVPMSVDFIGYITTTGTAGINMGDGTNWSGYKSAGTSYASSKLRTVPVNVNPLPAIVEVATAVIEPTFKKSIPLDDEKFWPVPP